MPARLHLAPTFAQPMASDARANDLPTLRQPHYPTALIDTRRLAGRARRAHPAAERLTLRPVLPQDQPLLADMMSSLSPLARRRRFHGAVKPSIEQFRRMSCPDFSRELALVVTASEGSRECVIADARYVVRDDARTAEFALVVDERWQREGVGLWALQALERAARAAGLQWLEGLVLGDNEPMLALTERAGFTLGACAEGGEALLALRSLAPEDDDRSAQGGASRGGLLARLLNALDPLRGLRH